MAVKLTGPLSLREVNDYLGHPHGNPPNSISMNGGWLRSQTGNYPTNTSYRMSDMYGMMTQYGPFSDDTAAARPTFYTKFWSGGTQTDPFSAINWDASSQNNGADGYSSSSTIAGGGVGKGRSASNAWVAVADVVAQGSGGGLFSAEWKFQASRSTDRYRHMIEMTGMSIPFGGDISYIYTTEFTLGESTQVPTLHSWTSIRPYINCTVYNHALEGSKAGQKVDINADYCNLRLISES